MRTSTKTQGVHVRHFFSHPYLTRWPFQVKCAPVNIRNMCVSFPTSFPKSLQHHSQKVCNIIPKKSQKFSKSFPRFPKVFHGFVSTVSKSFPRFRFPRFPVKKKAARQEKEQTNELWLVIRGRCYFFFSLLTYLFQVFVIFLHVA